jgi:hypothetical protein
MSEHSLPPGPWDKFRAERIPAYADMAAATHAETIQTIAANVGVRAALKAELPHNAEGIDTARAEHLVRALGLSLPEYIIVDSDSVSPTQAREILSRHRIPPKPDKTAYHTGHYPQLGIAVIHPGDSQIDGMPPEALLLHELLHAGARLPGLWDEGWVVYATTLLDKAPDTPPQPAALGNTDRLGAVILSNLCDRSPELFETMLRLRGSGTAGEYAAFFQHMDALIGMRRFAYLMHAKDLTPELLKNVADLTGRVRRSTTRMPTAVINTVLRGKLLAYEQKTGHSFAGDTASRSDAPADADDSITARLKRLAQGFMPGQ